MPAICEALLLFSPVPANTLGICSSSSLALEGRRVDSFAEAPGCSSARPGHEENATSPPQDGRFALHSGSAAVGYLPAPLSGEAAPQPGHEPLGASSISRS